MKRKVLAILKNHIGQHISGAEIAGQLGVSRAAVWKAVESLRTEGYAIHAVTNTGYCIDPSNNVIDADEIKQALRTKTIGTNLEILDEVTSTNDIAKEKAKMNAPEGTLIIAKKQSAGKGRYGRTFYSPKNGSIYMSILLRPSFEVKDASFITVTAAVAVNRAIREMCGIDSKIKWVNDITIDHRKICGILTEAGFEVETGSLNFVVVGIGINLSSEFLPEEISDIASGILEHATKSFSVNTLIAEILYQLENFYDKNCRAEIIEQYRTMSSVLGERVFFEKDGKKLEGKAQSIDDDASLLIMLDNGILMKVQSGEVSIKMIR